MTTKKDDDDSDDDGEVSLPGCGCAVAVIWFAIVAAVTIKIIRMLMDWAVT